MNVTRRAALSLAGIAGALGLAACADTPEPLVRPDEPQDEPEQVEQEPEPEEPQVDLTEFEDLAIDPDAWNYDATNDCYYQLALPYCLKPGSEQYESFSIFVPGAYLTGKKKGSGYSCAVNPEGRVGSYTAATAPVVMPINPTHGSGQMCPTSYSYEGLGRYLEAGLVYVYAGFRGRTGGYESTTQAYYPGGIPWALTDLKSVVRCLRYNAAVLPCDTARVFLFGCGGGGGYSAIMGVTGNDEAYLPYLEALGAATHDVEGTELGDAICGSASWCPLLSFDSSDAAYEWMMGQFSSTDSRTDGTWTALLSRDLAAAYGTYVNGLGLTDANDDALTIDQIDDGSYAGGSYYDHILDTLREAAEDFLGRTKFPYTSMPPLTADPAPFPGDPDYTQSAALQEPQEASESPSVAPGVWQVQATVYESLESYVAALNGGSRWLTYNASKGEADITGLWSFVAACRPASKAVCAYDLPDRSGSANQLFGTEEQPSLHFDAMVAELLSAHRDRYEQAQGWDAGLVASWEQDLEQLDDLGASVVDRVTMASPLSHLQAGDEEHEGIAPHWRINSGLFQAETTLVGEANLACALKAHPAVSDVHYEQVWGAGFGLAERTGDPEDNLVAWVCACCPEAEENE